jgi:hypothetical protein
LDSGLRRNDVVGVFLVLRVIVLNTCGAVLSVLANIRAGLSPPYNEDSSPRRRPGPNFVRKSELLSTLFTLRNWIPACAGMTLLGIFGLARDCRNKIPTAQFRVKNTQNYAAGIVNNQPV